MFNFFKPKPQVQQHEEPQPTTTLPPSRNYPAIVHEIHSEFNKAGEKLLAESLEVLATCKIEETEKGKRLAKLGFVNVPQVKQATELEEKINTAKQDAELVRYYAREYPFNKFINWKQVTQICEKYGLVCGDIGLYKGFVPEDKLTELENFKLKPREENMLVADNGFAFENAEIRQDGAYYHLYKIGTEKSHFNYAFQSNDGSSFYGNDKYNIFGLSHLVQVRRFSILTGFQICAPLKDMDMTGHELRGNFLVKNIPDPVVLKPVKGGALIGCAWGDEASDPIVVNSINN